MNENRTSVVHYVLGVLAVEALLLGITFFTAGLVMEDFGFTLGCWGIAALLFGVWMLGGSDPGTTGMGAIKAMRGEAGAHPLARLASMQEYKLEKLRERPLQEEAEQLGAQPGDGSESATPQSEAPGLIPTCVTVAGALALGLGWLLGRIYPR